MHLNGHTVHASFLRRTKKSNSKKKVTNNRKLAYAQGVSGRPMLD